MYDAQINALARSGEKDAARKAIDLLSEMVELCQLGDKDVRPNLISFNAVLNTLSKARTVEAAQRAEELLEQMESLHKRSELYRSAKPNVISYTAVVSSGIWCQLHFSYNRTIVMGLTAWAVCYLPSPV